MICPFCNTENRDDRETCYFCNKDLSMLRLIVNKAKHHYNLALEHAERGRYSEAIIELQNVLDLDNKNINAHIVLGTIYAKMDEYNKAIEEWQRALELDTRFAKAHTYLEKAKTATEQRGIYKLARNLSIALSICVAIIVGLLFFQIKPNKDIIIAEQTNKQYYEQRNFKKSLEMINNIIQNSTNKEALLIAEGIKNNIQCQINIHCVQIENAIQNGDYLKAYKIGKRLMLYNPDSKTMSILDFYNNKITESICSTLKQAIHSFDYKDASYKKIDEYLSDVKKNLPQSEDIDTLSLEFSKITKNFFNNKLLVIKSHYFQKKDFSSAIDSLVKLKETFPTEAAQNQIQSTIDIIVKDKISFMGKNIAALIDSNNLNDAEKEYAELNKFVNQFNVKSTDAEDIEKKLLSKKSANYIENIKRLYEQKDYEALEHTKFEGDTQLLSDKDKEMIEKYKNKARRSLAIKYWQWYLTLDRKFVKKEIKEKDAKLAIERAELTLKYFPKSYKYVQDNILFYTAVSYENLGERNKAKELYKQLATDYPTTAYGIMAKENLNKLLKIYKN